MKVATETKAERDVYYRWFVEEIIADPDLAPQLSDPHRIPAIEVYAKGTFPDRTPDISTPRTDVYITHWEDKDPNDPFYRDEFDDLPEGAEAAGDDDSR